MTRVRKMHERSGGPSPHRNFRRPRDVGRVNPGGPYLAHDDERTQRLETAVDAIAIEVERISEAQRFMIGLLGDSLPARRGEIASPGQGRVITPH